MGGKKKKSEYLRRNTIKREASRKNEQLFQLTNMLRFTGLLTDLKHNFNSKDFVDTSDFSFAHFFFFLTNRIDICNNNVDISRM